jgi:hypothetical protein
MLSSQIKPVSAVNKRPRYRLKKNSLVSKSINCTWRLLKSGSRPKLGSGSDLMVIMGSLDKRGSCRGGYVVEGFAFTYSAIFGPSFGTSTSET